MRVVSFGDTTYADADADTYEVSATVKVFESSDVVYKKKILIRSNSSLDIVISSPETPKPSDEKVNRVDAADIVRRGV